MAIGLHGLMLAPLPLSIRAGWVGEVASWVLPSSILTNAWGGGGGGQGTALTHDNVSYVLSSTIPELYIPDDNSISNYRYWTLHSYPRFSPFNRMTPSPCFLWRLGMTGSSGESSAPWSVLYPDHSQGPAVVLVGTRTGDSRIRVSLSNRRGPIKVPGSVNSANRMKIPNQCPL